MGEPRSSSSGNGSGNGKALSQMCRENNCHETNIAHVGGVDYMLTRCWGRVQVNMYA